VLISSNKPWTIINNGSDHASCDQKKQKQKTLIYELERKCIFRAKFYRKLLSETKPKAWTAHLDYYSSQFMHAAAQTASFEITPQL
jgi:hypothetical protein